MYMSAAPVKSLRKRVFSCLCLVVIQTVDIVLIIVVLLKSRSWLQWRSLLAAASLLGRKNLLKCQKLIQKCQELIEISSQDANKGQNKQCLLKMLTKVRTNKGQNKHLHATNESLHCSIQHKKLLIECVKIQKLFFETNKTANIYIASWIPWAVQRSRLQPLQQQQASLSCNWPILELSDPQLPGQCVCSSSPPNRATAEAFWSP